MTEQYRIRKISSGIISTVAGGGTSTQDNVAATEAAILAFYVAVDDDGAIYIADGNTPEIKKVTSDGLIHTIWDERVSIDIVTGLLTEKSGGLYYSGQNTRQVKLLTPRTTAQPVISAIRNNYSWISPGLLNYGIAPGSIFVIGGTGIGPSSLTALQQAPLNETYGGVTINVRASDGKTYRAIPYYASEAQIGAVLPSATPTGIGTITVTFGGQTSVAFPIPVVYSAFGMLTRDGTGSGPAAAFDASSNYLSATNAVNPGEYVTLWGSGLGSSPDGDTELNTNFTNLGAGITVLIGNQSAAIQYAGRSAYPGLDQINVQVPTGVSGCSVSVVVQSGTYVSNTSSIPVTTSGRICSTQMVL